MPCSKGGTMRHAKIVLAILATVGLSACGGADSPGSSAVASPTGAQVSAYENAKKEPGLTWYSSQDPASNKAVVEAFNKQYPDVKVTALRLASGELATRYAQERGAGVLNAGLVTLASPAFVQKGTGEGWFEKIVKSEYPEVAELPDQFFKDGIATTGISVFGIGYNTNTVKTPPKTWEDVLAPEYKGKIIFGDPRNVPAYMALARVWMDEYGPDFLGKLNAQQLTVVDSMVPGTQQLAAGEGSIGLPSVETVLKPVKDKGAPLGFVIPDLTTGNEFQTMVSTGTKSPNAARLLYQFLFTDAGQLAFNGSTSASPLRVAGTAPLPSQYIAPRIDELPQYQPAILKQLGFQG